MGLDTWESRTRDLDEKKKVYFRKRNKELLEQGVFKLGVPEQVNTEEF